MTCKASLDNKKIFIVLLGSMGSICHNFIGGENNEFLTENPTLLIKEK